MVHTMLTPFQFNLLVLSWLYFAMLTPLYLSFIFRIIIVFDLKY